MNIRNVTKMKHGYWVLVLILYKCYIAQGVDEPFSNVSTALCQGHLETCFKTKWKSVFYLVPSF